MLFVNEEKERGILEACLKECKRRLNYFREVGDDIQAALHEADVNRMLEELKPMYERQKRTHDRLEQQQRAG